jgi:hypothetical protein
MFLLPMDISEKSQNCSETCHSSKIPEECIKNIKDEVVLLNIFHFYHLLYLHFI